MSPLRVFQLGAALITAALVVLLATDEVGVGPTPADSPSTAPYFPNVLEDHYDHRSYQKRGRWLPAGTVPYLEEHSEYPQVSTWLFGLPYLLFDHAVEPGTPYDTRERIWSWFRDAGAPRDWYLRLDDAIEHSAGTNAVVSDAPGVAPLLGQFSALDDADVEGARARVEELGAAWREYHNTVDRDREDYADWHQVHMALWFLVLLYALVGILVEMGRPPVYALLLFLPSTLYYSFARSDMIVTALLAVTLLAWMRRRHLRGGLWLGVATMAKWWPGFIGPLLALWAVRDGRAENLSAGRPPDTARLVVRRLLVPAAAALSVCAVVFGVTFVWSGGGWPAVEYLFDWYLNRRLPNHASVYALLLSPERLGWLGPEDASWLGRLFLGFQVGVPLALALLPIRDRDTLLKACLVVAIGMLMFQKFFSPQWVMWATVIAIPLAARRPGYLVALVAMELVIYLQMPLLYYHALAHVSDAASFEPFWAVTYLRVVAFAVYWVVVLVDTIRSALRSHPSLGAPADGARVAAA